VKNIKKYVTEILIAIVVALMFMVVYIRAQLHTDDTSLTSSEDNLIVVGFSQVGAESDWRVENTESFKSTFTEENGYYLLYSDAQQKQENQIKAIRSFILQNVDYIVFAPIVETGWDAVLEEAKAAGIPVIITDRMVDVEDDSLYVSWVGADFELEGEKAGEWLSSYLSKNLATDEDINIVTLEGTIGASAQIGRTKGFNKYLHRNSNWHMLDTQSADFTQAKGQEVMEEYLKKYPDIDVVVSQNDNMTFGAINAIEAAGKTCGPDGDIIIISFDAIFDAVKLVEDKKINVTVECNPVHGPIVEEIIEQLERGETPEKIIYVEEGVISLFSF
jgi:simple sugar transport system substrate-binding protein